MWVCSVCSYAKNRTIDTECRSCNAPNPKNKTPYARPSSSKRKHPLERRKEYEIFKNAGRRAGTRAHKKAEETYSKDSRSAKDFLKAQKATTRPKLVIDTAEKIYTGNRGFRDEFREAYWKKNKKKRCVKCDCELTEENRTIDHIKDWATGKIGLETQTVCKEGYHWEVLLQSTVDEFNENTKNLQAMCQSCNSSKSGSKTSDSMLPQRLMKDTCNGLLCEHAKAE